MLSPLFHLSWKVSQTLRHRSEWWIAPDCFCAPWPSSVCPWTPFLLSWAQKNQQPTACLQATAHLEHLFGSRVPHRTLVRVSVWCVWICSSDWTYLSVWRLLFHLQRPGCAACCPGWWCGCWVEWALCGAASGFSTCGSLSPRCTPRSLCPSGGIANRLTCISTGYECISTSVVKGKTQ